MLLYFSIILFITANYCGLELPLLREEKYLWLFLAALNIVGIALLRSGRCFKLCVCFFFVLLGFINGGRAGTTAEEQLSSYWGETAIVQGCIDIGSIKKHEKGYSFLIQCEQAIIAEQPIEYKHKLRVFLEQKQLDEFLSKSDSSLNSFDFFDNDNNSRILTGRLVLSGCLEKIASFRNPGSFDSKVWNRVHGVGGRLTKAKLHKTEPVLSIAAKAALVNNRLRNFLQRRLSTVSAPLLGGMVLGGGAELDEETRDLFAENGIAHLLSVSGAHLAFLASMLSLLLRPLPAAWRRALILLLLLAYSALCGFKPPIMRALCMSAVVLWGGSGGERGVLLGLTAVVLLLYEPVWLLDLGFQLSFLAVAGIIWLQPKCQQLLERLLPDFISELGAVTLAAQLAVIPLEITYFHQVSLISIVSNLCLVPVLEIAVFLILIGLVFSITPIGEYFFLVASFLTEQVVVQAGWLAGLPFNTAVIGTLPLWSGLVYYVLVIVWADVPVAMYLSNIQRYYVLLLCSGSLIIAFYMSTYGAEPLTAYFLDVGQGDCAVIVTPKSWWQEGKVIVFDTSGLKNYSTGSKILAPFLRTLGKRDIDMLVLSHYDFDHVGGAVDLSRVCDAKQVILPKEIMTSESEKMVLAMAKHWRSCNFVVAEKGMEFCFNSGNSNEKLPTDKRDSKDILKTESAGDIMLSSTDALTLAGIYAENHNFNVIDTRQYNYTDVLLKIINVPYELESGNEASTVAEISYKKYKLLFTGDMGEARENGLSGLSEYDVLKAGHHGSRYSSSEYFLKQTRPKLTIISCGAGNRHGHPHQETLERFAFYGSKVLRTDRNGCIKLVFEEDEIQVYSYNQGKWARI